MRTREIGVRSVRVTSLCELKAYASEVPIACRVQLAFKLGVLIALRYGITDEVFAAGGYACCGTDGCIGEPLTYRSCGPLWRDLVYRADHHAGEMLAHAAAEGGVASELLSDGGCGEE